MASISVSCFKNKDFLLIIPNTEALLSHKRSQRTKMHGLAQPLESFFSLAFTLDAMVIVLQHRVISWKASELKEIYAEHVEEWYFFKSERLSFATFMIELMI